MAVTRSADALLLIASEVFPATDATAARRLDLALGGAVLVDLALARRLVVDESTVRVVDRTPTNDMLYDSTLAAIAADAAPGSPGDWVARLARTMRPLVLSRLIATGDAREVPDGAGDSSGWGFVPVTSHRDLALRPEFDVRARLRDVAVFGAPPDGQLTALCGLVIALGVDRGLYPDIPQQDVTDRLTAAAGVAIGDAATRAAVRSAQAAVAATAAAITATT